MSWTPSKTVIPGSVDQLGMDDHGTYTILNFLEDVYLAGGYNTKLAGNSVLERWI